MTFHAGQKVECINNSQRDGFRWDLGADVPELKKVYTVSGLFRVGPDDGIFLLEIKNTVHDGGYRADRFRPIVERKTDISIFERMLLPQGVDA